MGDKVRVGNEQVHPIRGLAVPRAQELTDANERQIQAAIVTRTKELKEWATAQIQALQLPALWPADALDGIIPPENLPIFTLSKPGAVPAAKSPNLWLSGDGWKSLPTMTTYIGGGGGGYRPTPIILALAALPNAIGYLHNDGAGNLTWLPGGGGGVTDHPLLTHLDYAHAGHVDFAGTKVANIFDHDNRGTEFIGTRGCHITYDINGNVTQVAKTGGRTIDYTWVAGELVSCTDGTNTWTPTYDGFGNITDMVVT